MPTKDEILRFSVEIENMSNTNHTGLIETIIDHCDAIGLDFEDVKKLLSDSLKAKLRNEAESLHFMKKKESKLPL